MLEREIRAVELKQKALARDRFILDLKRAADRGKISVFGVVMFVADRRHHDAGRGGGQEGFNEAALSGALAPIEHLAEVGAFAHRFRCADIVDVADHLRGREVADHLLAGVLMLQRPLENRIVLDVGARPALPRSPKARHPVTDMEEEAFALLFAVIADIDSGFDLLWNDLL